MRFPRFRRSALPRLKSPDDKMSLRDHLAEFRTRLVRAILAVIAGFILILLFYKRVLEFLAKPLFRLCTSGTVNPGSGKTCAELVSLSPLDAFGARVSISVYGGLLLALPVVMWQLWRFIAPALHHNEKRYAVWFVLSSVGLFLLGCAIAYLTLQPALEFLINFGQAQPTYQISKYVSFVGLMGAAFGIGFQFPVLLVFLQLVRVINSSQLVKYWRHAIVVVVIIAATITPSGDPISLLALAIPMTFLYFVSIIVGKFIERGRAKKARAA